MSKSQLMEALAIPTPGTTELCLQSQLTAHTKQTVRKLLHVCLWSF